MKNQRCSSKWKRSCSQIVTTIVMRSLISKMDLQSNNHNHHQLLKTQSTFEKIKGHYSQKLNANSKTKCSRMSQRLLSLLMNLAYLTLKLHSKIVKVDLTNAMTGDKQSETRECHACSKNSLSALKMLLRKTRMISEACSRKFSILLLSTIVV